VAGRGQIVNDASLTKVLTEFARLLVNDYEISDALHDLVEGVTEVLEIAGAGVSLADDERIVFVTAAPGPVGALERVQEQTQQGPCVDAHHSGQVVLVADLNREQARWPALAEAATSVGMVAVAGIPMHQDEMRLGALNLYDSSRRDWSREEVAVAALLADMATGYVANASRLHQARHTAEQLQIALDSRVLIEQAKGMVAAERNIPVDQAFEILRDHSRRHNTPLRSVAEAVVNLRLRP
jgi:GAF domain-containing protein